MRVNIKNLTSAMAKVTAFASLGSNAPGVMLDIAKEQGILKVCFSDGRRAVIESMGVGIEDGDFEGLAVFDYDKLRDLLSVCQPSGGIVTDDLDVKINSDGTVQVKVEKKFVTGEGENKNTKTCSIIKKSMNWVKPDASIKTSVLYRTDYNSIFDAEDSDEWNVGEFKGILNVLISEKGKVIYISPSSKKAFVRNTAFASKVMFNSECSHSVAMNTVAATAVYEILGKLDDSDSISVHTIDRKHLCIYNSEKTIGIMADMVDGLKADMTALKYYEDGSYKDCQFIIKTEVLKNVIKSAADIDKAQRVHMKFEKGADGVGIKISADDNIDTGKNQYTVICEHSIVPDKGLEGLKIPLSLKVIQDILGKCSTREIGFDIGVVENGKLIRIAELDIDKRIKVVTDECDRLKAAGEEINKKDVQLNFREKYLMATHYTISNS